MTGEPILVIDDTPVNLKLTRILLANEGYEVRTAPDAEQALSILEEFHPALMLVDIQLPGIDGLELTRRVKADPRNKDIVVVALTAFAMKGDEQRAMEAGCDGYITKPIDTRTLPSRVRDYLEARKPQAAAAAAPTHDFSLSGPEVETLRLRFLDEGLTQSREMLDLVGGAFDALHAGKLLHQWVGAAGLLGYPDITRLAREVEQLLQERPLDNAQLRDSLNSLVYAFSSPPDAVQRPVPESIAQTLGGRRFALIGFSETEAERMCATLTRAGGLPHLFAATEPADSEGVQGCDVVMVHVHSATLSTVWLSTRPAAALPAKPIVLVGDREVLLDLAYPVQMRAQEFLLDAWHPEEALIRASRALSQAKASGASGRKAAAQYPAARARPQILLADDDPTVLALVRTTLMNYGMDVRCASNGSEALNLLREQPPDGAILDVNMPGVDGFELLASIRRENLPTRVILLTARQQEGDVIRGFSLGADDYVVKPFSPLELVARLKRLLYR